MVYPIGIREGAIALSLPTNLADVPFEHENKRIEVYDLRHQTCLSMTLRRTLSSVIHLS